ncbi:MAG: hypothetical protein GW859_05520 [Sphingomonadales bacterium]|nr:hypothetical protein [Sphingomonadales bacterium]
MTDRKFLLVPLIASLAVQPAGAIDVVALPASTPWVVDYDPDNCTLLRRFGADDDAIIAQFIRYAPGSSFELRLIGKPVKLRRERAVHIGFGEPVEYREVRPTLGQVGEDATPLLFMGNFHLDPDDSNDDDDTSDRATPAPVPQAEFDSLTLRIDKGRKFKLVTGAMGEPLAALDKCVGNLMESWGISQVEIARVATPPKPSNTGKWLTTSDYPRKPLYKGIGSRVNIALIVGADGTVEKCRVQSLTDDREFGKVTCDLISARAKFEPALDVDGIPVRSLYTSLVRWKID